MDDDDMLFNDDEINEDGENHPRHTPPLHLYA
jgi:hypothetical protein